MTRETGKYKRKMNGTLWKALKYVKWGVKRSENADCEVRSTELVKLDLRVIICILGTINTSRKSATSAAVETRLAPWENPNHGTLYRLTLCTPPLIPSASQRILCHVHHYKGSRDKNVTVTKKESKIKRKEVHPDPYTSSRKNTVSKPRPRTCHIMRSYPTMPNQKEDCDICIPPQILTPRSTMNRLLQVGRSQSLNNARSFAEPCLEDTVGVLEHAVLQ